MMLHKFSEKCFLNSIIVMEYFYPKKLLTSYLIDMFAHYVECG